MKCVVRDDPRTGWSLTSHISECVLNMVCERPPRLRRFGGLRRLFVNAAATPPLQGGECSRPTHSQIETDLLTQDTRSVAFPGRRSPATPALPHTPLFADCSKDFPWRASLHGPARPPAFRYLSA